MACAVCSLRHHIHDGRNMGRALLGMSTPAASWRRRDCQYATSISAHQLRRRISDLEISRRRSDCLWIQPLDWSFSVKAPAQELFEALAGGTWAEQHDANGLP